jgi:5-(carboxyamino)imidazole ribonucleotide synthase
VVLPPGSTIGIIGGGQLGRMLAIAAAQLGYRCHIFAPDEAPCGADVAAEFTRATYDDEAALARFATACDAITYEFENLPVAPLEQLDDKLRPGLRSLAVAQDRADEKAFLESAGARVAPWARVDDVASLAAAVETLGVPLVLKTRRLGYDGKGQSWVHREEDALEAWESIGREPAVAECAMRFAAEFSVIVARAENGETAPFPVARNTHAEGILRWSEVPAGPLVEPHIAEATRITTAIADRLEHVGVLTVEFFACEEGPIVNEIAPRVHNSGHWSIEGATTSQFEQHIRAVAGLPLGDPSLAARGASMENLIGDDADRWMKYAAESGAHLHLYGKGATRPGRKMGHVTRVA